MTDPEHLGLQGFSIGSRIGINTWWLYVPAVHTDLRKQALNKAARIKRPHGIAFRSAGLSTRVKIAMLQSRCPHYDNDPPYTSSLKPQTFKLGCIDCPCGTDGDCPTRRST